MKLAITKTRNRTSRDERAEISLIFQRNKLEVKGEENERGEKNALIR